MVPRSIFLFGLFITIVVLSYIVQNMAFRKKISESATSKIMTIACIAYMVFSIILVRKLEIPFLLTGFLNLFTVGIMLKVISYSHVLNNIRYYIKIIKTEKNTEALDEILAEVSKQVS